MHCTHRRIRSPPGLRAALWGRGHCANARASLRQRAGCRQFDVGRDPTGDAVLLLRAVRRRGRGCRRTCRRRTSWQIDRQVAPWVVARSCAKLGCARSASNTPHREGQAMTLNLGCIADDFTGATDLANNLVRAGTAHGAGASACPRASAGAPRRCGGGGAEVAHRAGSRGGRAIAGRRALAARAGRRQIYFKVCSTFDSTPQGNIGPVAEALRDADWVRQFVVVTPAFPENGAHRLQGPPVRRRPAAVRQPMRQHPLTPMTDANLVRVLQAQLSGTGRASG
jgi:hypothetical protein